MTRPRLLDLFSGAGGAARGYQQTGFYVVGVDINPQPRYAADEFHQADAMTFPLDGFDAIHASPPCQAWTAYRRRGEGVGDGYPDVIRTIRRRLVLSGKPYVIENIIGSPIWGLIQLCGSSFGLDVRRHRLFEANFPVMSPPCNHAAQAPRFPPATNRTNKRSTVEIGVWRIPLAIQRQAMGIDWMSLPELTEAIPPAYTKYIGAQLLDHLKAAA